MCLRRKKKGNSECLADFVYVIQKSSRGNYDSCAYSYCSNVNRYSSAPESNRPNLPDRTSDFPFFFRLKHITSLKSLPLPAPSESLPYWFQGNSAAVFVLVYCLREFLLSALANSFELNCEPKRLMLLHYKICPRFAPLAENVSHDLPSNQNNPNETPVLT